MNGSTFLRTVLLTALLAIAAAWGTPAAAQRGGGSATAITSTSVRAGPGPRFQVIGVIRSGERVSVGECRNGWCRVSRRGPNGWVSRGALRFASGGGGGGSGGGRQVCFFERANFRGASFCAPPGTTNAALGQRGSRVASVRIDGRLSVDLCAQRNFRNCQVFSRDVASLGRSLQNNVGSFRVGR